jgi:predicted ribosomally synthesized peptide with SipW-like signal peptide
MKKIGLIAIIVVLALGIIGVGYAAWTQVLNVSGTATAGTFDINLVGSPSQPAAPPHSGTGTFAITDAHDATITLSNIYPGYDTGTMSFSVKNIGSIDSTTSIAVGTISVLGGTGTPSGSDLTVTVLPASSVTIPAGATDASDFSVDIKMNSSVTASQGAVYTIPITVTGYENP